MIKTEAAYINGKQIKVTQLGYLDGIELLTKLLKLAGVAFSKGEGSASFSLSALASSLKADDLKQVIASLAKRTIIEREPDSGKWPKLEPEVDLAGDYNFMFRWLKFALEVNYGSFFGEGGILENEEFLGKATSKAV